MHYENILPEVARQSSEMERRADEAERETDKLKKVEYMKDHIGEAFQGVISGMTSWGMFVELPNTIEGMVPVTAMYDDYYHYIESSYEMAGESGGRRYKLGQSIEVVCMAVDTQMRTIEFAIAEDGAPYGLWQDDAGNGR